MKEDEARELARDNSEEIFWIWRSICMQGPVESELAPAGWRSYKIRLWGWAAQQGEPRAQFNLAEMYMKGIGVPKDLKKSLSLFAQAAKRFDVSKQLKEVSSQMEQEETAELH